MVRFNISSLRIIKDVLQHKGLRKYFVNTSWLLSEKIVRLVVGVFVGVWVARYLGPDRFGLLAYAQSFVGLFAAVATMGLDSIVVRELVRREGERDSILGSAFMLKILGGGLVLIFLFGAIMFASNDFFTNLLIYIIAAAAVFQCFNVVDFYFQAKVIGRYIAYANIGALLISSIIKIVLILCGASLLAFAWAIFLDSVVLALGYLYVYKREQLSFSRWHFVPDEALRLLKDSWPLIFSAMVVAIYMKIDQVMLKEMMNAAAVGQYAAAVRISEAWYFIPIVICSSLFPAIINAKVQSSSLYYSRLQRLYRLMVWLAIAVALPMSFLSSTVVQLLYGDQYKEAAAVLTIHIWSGIVVFFGVANNKWLLSENLQGYRLFVDGFGAFSNVILNLILIPLYGVVGAALATLFSYLGSMIIVFSVFPALRRALGMFFLSFIPFDFYFLKAKA